MYSSNHICAWFSRLGLLQMHICLYGIVRVKNKYVCKKDFKTWGIWVSLKLNGLMAT